MDRNVHLKKTDPHTEASVTLDMFWVTQSDLDGLHDLLVWVEGYQCGKDDRVIPGHLDTMMFHRKLTSYVAEVNRPPQNDGETRLFDKRPVGE